MDPAGGHELAKRHLDAQADSGLLRRRVREFAAESASAVEVDGDEKQRRIQRVRQPIDRVRGERAGHVRHRLRQHVVDGVAAEADPAWRQMPGAAGSALARDKAEFPLAPPKGRRSVGMVGVRSAGRLAVEQSAPGQIGRVGEPVTAGSDLSRHGLRRPMGGQRLSGAQHRRSGSVGEGQDDNVLAGLGAVEHIGEQEAGMRGSRVADAGGEIVGNGLGAHAGLLCRSLHRTGRQTGDDQVIHKVRGQVGLLDGVGECRCRKREIDLLAEALLPGVATLARPVCASGRGTPRSPMRSRRFLQASGVRRCRARRRRRRRRRPRRARQLRPEGRCARRRARRGWAWRSAPRRGRRPLLNGLSRPCPPPARVGRAATRRAARWRWSCPGTAGVAVAKYSCCTAALAPGSLRATRAASTPSEVESSSYEATARAPLPPPLPRLLPMSARSSRW